MTKEMMRKAHKLTKEMKQMHPEVNYQLQLGLFITFLLEEEEMKMSYNEKMIRECVKPYKEAYREKFGTNPTSWFGFLKYVSQVSFAGGFDNTEVELAKQLLGL